MDYGFGIPLQRDTAAKVKELGGEVLGSVMHPLNSADFSSYLLKAQSSGAKVVAFANGGTDTMNSVSQAYEFGLQRNQMFAGMAIDVLDIHAVGLAKLQGTYLVSGGYWDTNAATRKFSQRFFEKIGRMPVANQMGVYVMTGHYLRAVQALGSDASGKAVVAKMREIPIEDLISTRAWLREDGRVMRDLFLGRVKSPGESKGEWDLIDLADRVHGDQAYRPRSSSECRLLRS